MSFFFASARVIRGAVVKPRRPVFLPSRGRIGRRLKEELAAAVFLPGGFVIPRVRGAVFAVAYGINAAGVDAQSDEFLAQRQRAAVPQSAIVLFRAALVTVAVDFDGVTGVGL